MTSDNVLLNNPWAETSQGRYPFSLFKTIDQLEQIKKACGGARALAYCLAHRDSTGFTAIELAVEQLVDALYHEDYSDAKQIMTKIKWLLNNGAEITEQHHDWLKTSKETYTMIQWVSELRGFPQRREAADILTDLYHTLIATKKTRMLAKFAAEKKSKKRTRVE